MAALGLVVSLTACGRLGYDGLGHELDTPTSAIAGDEPSDIGDPFGDDGAPVDDGGDEPTDEPGAPGDDTDAGTEDPPAVPSTRPTFERLCDFSATVRVTDGATVDDSAGTAMQTALAGFCLALTMSSVSQDDPGVLDDATFRPLLGPDALAIMAGGPEVHRGSAYLGANTAPVARRQVDSSKYELVEVESGRVVLSVPVSTLTLTHDYALLMMSDEPISQTVVLSSYGYEELGTLAGARFFAENGVDTTKRWYVIEWSANDPGDDSDDSYAVVASG